MSRNQLEYLVKLCNEYDCTIAPVGEGNARVLLSTSQFNQIIKMVSDSQALVEPGITIERLNGEIPGREVPLPARAGMTVEEAIQHNAVCFSSLKQGFFNDTNSVVRVGLIKGSGEPIQTGGNKVSDAVSFGLPITKLIVGSNYTLGLVYEA